MHPKHTAVEIPCQQCGKPFRAYVSHQRQGGDKYCSRACYVASIKPRTTLEGRFWSKVDCSGGPDACWLWQGGMKKGGYGVLSRGSRGTGMVRAIRVSWEIHHGPIPEGFEVCHNCPGGDNPRCVNPAHLFLGTHAENMADAARKGQMPRGERRPSAKLTEGLVREIRRRYAAGETRPALAVAFGISYSNVGYIVERKTWAHVA